MTAGINRIAVTSSGLTIATTNYAALDGMGGLLTLAGAAQATGGNGILHSILVIDESSTTSDPLRLSIFRDTVTLGTDNAVYSISDADAAKQVVDPVELDRIASYNNGSVQGRTGLYIPYDCQATSLYVGIQSLSTRAFFGAVTDLKFVFYVNSLA